MLRCAAVVPFHNSQTLCLLCSSLAWQESLEAGAADASVLVPAGVDGVEGLGASRGRPNVMPKIIYASRTHTQLSQVIQELKGSGYSPKIAVLGSREQLCVHREV